MLCHQRIVWHFSRRVYCLKPVSCSNYHWNIVFVFWVFCQIFNTAQKMKFSIKDFFSKCRKLVLVTFTEEILDGKLWFLLILKQRLHWRLNLHQLSWFLRLLKLFFGFDRSIIFFCSSFVIKALLLQYSSVTSNMQRIRHFVRISECSKYRKLRKNQELWVEFLLLRALFLQMGWYTYIVHYKCPIFKTPHPLVHLRPEFFHPLDLGRPIPKEPPFSLQVITNPLKENIIQEWLLYVIRSFLQVDFHFQYQLINLV